jgi:hypothetical protein
MALAFVLATVVTTPALAQSPGSSEATPAEAAPVEATSSKARAWALFAALGFGNAVCDNEKPDSDCPVDGAFTIAFGGSWRFHSRLSLGAELAIWAYGIRDEWQGGLDDTATDVSFTSFYLAPHLRWHAFEVMSAKPYLQAGFGIGSVTAEASNDAGTYEYSASGVVFPLAVGVEWRVGERFRIGPQAQAYLQVSSEICADEPDQPKECMSPGTNEDGEREGLLLPWRIVVTASFAL